MASTHGQPLLPRDLRSKEIAKGEALSADLHRILRHLASRLPDHPLPFIVTLSAGAASPADIPLRITHRFEAIHAFAADMTPAQAIALAEEPGVERIEFDGEAEALDGP